MSVELASLANMHSIELVVGPQWGTLPVTIAEMMPAYEDTGSNRFDRTPPQDMEAEQCVLGAMLMSKDAIADVVEVLRGGDFYRPAHEQVYNAITELYGRGEPADAVTVSDE